MSATEFSPFELLTETQVAGLLKVSRATVRSKFTPVFLGDRTKRYIAEDIQKFIANAPRTREAMQESQRDLARRK